LQNLSLVKGVAKIYNFFFPQTFSFVFLDHLFLPVIKYLA
jgi:hypothetical protein